MAISEEKMKIVINNYFKTECSVDTTIRQAFEKGFRLGAEKASCSERKKGKWINHRNDDGHNIADCDQCGEAMQWFDDGIKPKYCPICGAKMGG